MPAGWAKSFICPILDDGAGTGTRSLRLLRPGSVISCRLRGPRRINRSAPIVSGSRSRWIALPVAHSVVLQFRTGASSARESLRETNFREPVRDANCKSVDRLAISHMLRVKCAGPTWSAAAMMSESKIEYAHRWTMCTACSWVATIRCTGSGQMTRSMSRARRTSSQLLSSFRRATATNSFRTRTDNAPPRPAAFRRSDRAYRRGRKRIG